jgi:hypothetical protein
MVAAGSVVSRDIGAGVLAAGNPARVYGQYDEFLARSRAAAAGGRIFPLERVMDGAAGQAEARDALSRGEVVYVSGPAQDEYHFNVSFEETDRQAREAFRRNFGDGAPPQKD